KSNKLKLLNELNVSVSCVYFLDITPTNILLTLLDNKKTRFSREDVDLSIPSPQTIAPVRFHQILETAHQHSWSSHPLLYTQSVHLV
ncbi:hypothetical protein NPM06_33385, partial [Bacillus cereus]|uniref:hypothetical protein n=1 Tax=Bacillus cereus TaxID=1396 RepID=UPI0021134550|nr:hypothetical protein [Bacillus cereus]